MHGKMAGAAEAGLKAARFAWLCYLHLFFLLHQPLLPLPPSLRAAVTGDAAGSGGGPLRILSAIPAAERRAAAGGGGVRRSPPTATELHGLAHGFEKLRAAARSQRQPEARDALTQLGWHWNKAVLDHAASGEPAARRAATQAVDIAASTWPYWLAWPETHAKLALALGSESTAAVAVDQARTRFPPQRWQGWWREPRQPHSAPSDGGRAGSGGGIGSGAVPLLARVRRLAPFSSLVLLCASVSPPRATRCSHCSCERVRCAGHRHGRRSWN
eukprot:COSAG06_NODE_6133_length_3092_cov_1.235884_3_plen_272_part_00